ncbi:AAA family ATPase [Coprococcus comes]|uniref:AAA family ATPase n=1 Tax=Coprococcus comes TaxID=410072 RepID=UPI0034A24AA9
MNKEELLNLIKKGMVCDEEFLKKVYGYEISYPGYAEKALCKLEEVGVESARGDYARVRNYWESNGEKNMVSKRSEVKRLSDLEEKEIEWLVPAVIPRRQITVMAGEGGCGKTGVWCAIAAAISAGRSTFLVEPEIPKEFGNCKPEQVLFFSAEDSVEHTLIRKLRKNGANLDNIQAIDIAEKKFADLKFNSAYLEQLLQEIRPALCIFDPIQSFLPDRVKMSERNTMRNCMESLVGLGEKYGAAFLIVAHTNKQSSVFGRKRISDSADIWDISRSVLLVGETEEKGVNYISHEKSNYGRLWKTVLYSIEDERIVFKGYSNKKDRDFIMRNEQNSRQAPKKEAAKQFVLDFLRDGEKEINELNKVADIEGISKYTLRVAKEELAAEGKIQTRNEGFKNKKYYISRMQDIMTNK